MRHNIQNKWLSYQKQIRKTLKKRVRPRTLCVDDWVLKIAGHIQKGIGASKFVHKWEGLYVSREAYDGKDFMSLEKLTIVHNFLIPSLIHKIFCLLLTLSGWSCLIPRAWWKVLRKASVVNSKHICTIRVHSLGAYQVFEILLSIFL